MYADDVILIAPSRSALQAMLKVTEEFADEYKIIFSTHENPSESKSKCVWMCGKSEVRNYPAPLMLNSRPLPWVKTAAHLGHELSQKCDMEHAAWVARAKFIDKSVSVQEMFSFARPEQILAAVNIYCCDFYGSNLWNLYGERAEQCYRAYSTTVKLCFNLPRDCHTWAVTEVLNCGFPMARERVMSGYVRFLKRLETSASWEVRFLVELEARDNTVGK